jgi:hypothetical protein
MAKGTPFNFVSLACGSGGSVQGLIQAGGVPRFICDPRSLEVSNAVANFPNVPHQLVDARWFYNRKQKGSDDLLNKMGLEEAELDILEASVRFSGRNAASKALPSLNDLFGLAKRIQPKVLIAFGPSDLLRDKNIPLFDRQLDYLRYASLKDPERQRTYYVASRVLNAADLGAAVAKTYTVIIGVREDIAHSHNVAADMAILSIFPSFLNYKKGTIGAALADLTLPKGEEEFWEKETLLNKKLIKAAKFLPKDPNQTLWLPSFGAKQLKTCGYESSGGINVFRTSGAPPAPDYDFYDPKDKEKWGLLHPAKNRMLTATEIAAAMGLPRGYKLQGTDFDKARAAAEAIPPALTESVAKALLPLLAPATDKTVKHRALPSDALKILLTETLRSPASDIRAYYCDVDLGDTYARDLQGQMPLDNHYDYLFDANEIGQDFVVYGPVDPATGQRPVIGGVKRRVFEGDEHTRMIAAINKIKGTTEYRGSCSPEPIRQDILDRYAKAGRKLEISSDQRQFRLWIEAKGQSEGHWDRWRTNPIPSATEGWSLDKNTRKPQLSKNLATNADLKAEFDHLNRRAEYAYLKIAPVEFKKQRKFLQGRVSSEYRLGKTVFTSLAINKYGDEMPAMNFHIDSGDNNSGLTSISIFNKGQYEGGYFVMPQYRCAFKVGDGDVFVGNSRKVHGVTQIIGDGQRLSVVSYANTALGVDEYTAKAYPPRSPRPNFRVTSYQIGLPSYRRAETLKEKTLALLTRHKIDPKRVTIFVADQAEYEIYKKALEGNPYKKLVIAAPGIIGVRNFMRLFYKEGTPVLFIDDDIKDIEILSPSDKNELEPVANLERDIIHRVFNTMREYNGYIWGINAANNPMMMKETVSVGLYYIIASFYGNIIRHSDDLIIGTADKEDYERSVQHFIKDGRVVRLSFATADTKYYTEKGGLQETRTQATVEAGARYMLKHYPKYCYDRGERTKGSKKGMSEVALMESD